MEAGIEEVSQRVVTAEVKGWQSAGGAVYSDVASRFPLRVRRESMKRLIMTSPMNTMIHSSTSCSLYRSPYLGASVYVLGEGRADPPRSRGRRFRRGCGLPARLWV